MEKLYRVGDGPIVRVVSWGDICTVEIVEEGFLPGPMGGFVWSRGTWHPVVRDALHEVGEDPEEAGITQEKGESDGNSFSASSA